VCAVKENTQLVHTTRARAFSAFSERADLEGARWRGQGPDPHPVPLQRQPWVDRRRKITLHHEDFVAGA
jgi:hypothetical protein